MKLMKPSSMDKMCYEWRETPPKSQQYHTIKTSTEDMSWFKKTKQKKHKIKL